MNTPMRTLLPLFAVLLPLASVAQDVLDKVAQGACSCMSEKMNDKEALSDKEKLQMELGFCFLSAAAPHEKELRKKYDLDLSQADEVMGERLGVLIAGRMAAHCPNELMLLASFANEEEEAPEMPSASITGEVVHSHADRFLSLTVRGTDGRTLELLWLEHVPGAERIDVLAPKGRSAGFRYVQRELLDPTTGAYRSFNVITEITAP